MKKHIDARNFLFSCLFAMLVVSLTMGMGIAFADRPGPGKEPPPATKGSIAVTVMDATSKSLKDATVTILGYALRPAGKLTQTKTTNQFGKASFSNLPPDQYNVKVIYPGADVAYKDVTVSAGKTATVSFRLGGVKLGPGHK